MLWLLWTLTGIYTLILLFLFGSKRLRLSRDFFFTLFIAQAFIYLHIAPNFYAEAINEKRQVVYFVVQLFALLFYELPLIVLYRFFYVKAMYKPLNSVTDIKVNSGKFKTTVILVVAAIWAFAFISIALQYQMLFRRIGHEALYESTMNMPTWAFVVYRMFIDTGVFISCVLLVLYYKVQDKYVKVIALFSLIIYVGVYGAYVLINNRLQTIIYITTLFGVGVYFKNRATKSIKFKRVILFALLAIYLVKIVSNIRADFLVNQGNVNVVSVFNPFYKNIGDDPDPMKNRLNGIDMVALYMPEMPEKGLLYFEPWTHDIKVLFGSFVNSEYAQKSKANLATNARSVILNSYLNWDVVDYYQCQLSDVFATFGPIALLFASLLVCLYFAFITKVFHNPKNTFYLLFSFLILPYMLEFEKDFVNFLLGWVRVLPILFAIYWLKIFKITHNAPISKL